LLDRYLNSAPLGVPGELYIGGDGLARGYLNSPSLTAEKFIPNPFSNEPGTRLYKTGDLARYLPDGNIEFLGRMDDQVKIRGFRIEPGEIETALRKYAYIQDVTVINHEDETGHKRLVAYVTPKAKDFPTVSELRHFLQQKLPDYMIPSAFVFLEALPLNPNGKVDRRALPAPDSTRPNLNQDFTPPENDVEKVLAGIWEEVLDLKQVGLFDNFFELGGHSLLATQIISRINALFEIDTPLRTLFEAPTITELAKALLEPADSRQHIEQTAQLILELSELSDEEINVMLKGELSATKNKEN
jgi:acyl carrier protein